MKRRIDHIVYCVPDLDKAVIELHEKLGAKPVKGGRHLKQGTKNALLNLGDQCYLEILAIDEENTEIQAPRWMGIDKITNPQVTRWAIKTDDPQKDSTILKEYNEKMGKIESGSRKLPNGKLLEWDLVMPLPEPEVEIIPFMTDWSRSDSHPTDALEEDCKFMCMEFYHVEPSKVRSTLKHFREDIDLKKGDRNAIYLYIESPKGIIKI